jgi:hypothetical protein
MGISSLGTTTTASSPSWVSLREMEFWQAVSKMKGFRETQPLGGPKGRVKEEKVDAIPDNQIKLTGPGG